MPNNKLSALLKRVCVSVCVCVRVCVCVYIRSKEYITQNCIFLIEVLQEIYQLLHEFLRFLNFYPH